MAMTTPNAAPLDCTSYPHILDQIIALASWSTKFHLRRLSKGLRDQVDSHLFYHIVLFSNGPLRRSYDESRSPPGIDDLEIFAPGCRPLPPVLWEAHRPLSERMDAMRKLSYVRVVDWGVNMSHPMLCTLPADVKRAGLELRAQTQSLAPLLGSLTGVEIVRSDDCQLAPLGARTHIQFNNFVTQGPPWDRGISGPWMHWGEGIIILPAGVERLVLHVRYDPQHPSLDSSMWDVVQVMNYPLQELIIVLRPTSDVRNEVADANHLRENPVLGFLDDLIKWAIVLVARKAKVTLVGLDSMPASNLRLAKDATAAERTVKIKEGIRSLVELAKADWEEMYDMTFPYRRTRLYSAASLIRLISWAEYAAETPRDEYALALVRPRYRSLPARDFLGFPWRDDGRSIYPQGEWPSHLDWLAEHVDNVPPPLSPRPRPLDGDRCIRESSYVPGTGGGAYAQARGHEEAEDSRAEES